MNIMLLEGLFSSQSDDILVGNDGLSLFENLKQFIGKEIQIAVHFLPPLPIQEDEWGGGCCMWKPANCPFGHHNNPGLLLNMALRGVMRVEDDKWMIDSFDGSSTRIPFELLDGHVSRVAAATVFDVTTIQDSLSNVDVESLGIRVNRVTDLLNRVKEHAGAK